MDPEYKVGATNIFVAKGDKKVEGITKHGKNTQNWKNIIQAKSPYPVLYALITELM